MRHHAWLQIATSEMRRALRSPFFWVLLALAQFLFGMAFNANIAAYGKWLPEGGFTTTAVRDTFSFVALMLLFLTPFLTAPLFSEEYRSGTINLLLSSPISLLEIVLGKFLGVMTMYAFLLVLPALMLASVTPFVSLDVGLVVAQFSALLLVCGASGTIGMYLSSLSARPVGAALGCFAVLFLLWMAGLSRFLWSTAFSDFLGYLYFFGHSTRLIGGYVDSADVVYYLLLTVSFFMLTVRRLHNLRTLH